MGGWGVQWGSCRKATSAEHGMRCEDSGAGNLRWLTRRGEVAGAHAIQGGPAQHSFANLQMGERSKYGVDLSLANIDDGSAKSEEKARRTALDQNGEFAAVFNLEDYKASREKSFKQIEAAITKFREIKEIINKGLKFYSTLQDAITNIKQQRSDFVMTRNTVPRNDGIPSSNQRSNSQQQTDPGNMMPNPPHPQTPYYQPPEQPTMLGYTSPPPPYGSLQQPPPYHVPAAGSPPCPPPQHHQQPAASHEYGQSAYPGWRGQYYNAHAQQPGFVPRSPYTSPSPYPPPHQSGY
ncbi:hypothetical protein F0562_007981 [Nyssa sinensis]|uniref:ALIX V-shaped domain-containing protein n=1 Tax=Nyssa sinensis TaxID=561372 RepID=A0A5J5A6N1_9ASTE|nr:hypothetical protein F0562_007981 [Nyssa sinensis]